LGISEIRWTGEGKIKKDGYIFIYSGGDQHMHGVGVLIKENLEKQLIGYYAKSQRNILVKFKAKPFNISIIQTYAPTTDYDEENLEAYYDELADLMKEVKSDEVLLVIGDFNANKSATIHMEKPRGCHTTPD